MRNVSIVHIYPLSLPTEVKHRCKTPQSRTVSGDVNYSVKCSKMLCGKNKVEYDELFNRPPIFLAISM